MTNTWFAQLQVCKRERKSSNIDPSSRENKACFLIAWWKASLDAVQISEEKWLKTNRRKQTEIGVNRYWC